MASAAGLAGVFLALDGAGDAAAVVAGVALAAAADAGGRPRPRLGVASGAAAADAAGEAAAFAAGVAAFALVFGVEGVDAFLGLEGFGVDDAAVAAADAFFVSFAEGVCGVRAVEPGAELFLAGSLKEKYPGFELTTLAKVYIGKPMLKPLGNIKRR